MIKHVKKTFISFDENEAGLHVIFVSSVLLCTPGRPICIKIPCVLTVSRNDYRSADIVPYCELSLLADVAYVANICHSYRRILSTESVIQCGCDGKIESGSNTKKVNIYYMYRGFYKFNSFLKKPKLISSHLIELRRDLSIFYSMAMNQFGLTKYDLDGCSPRTAPLSQIENGEATCELCKGCCDWRF